jgi:cbb3-type cytochrome oxidase cytochrome c subunit
VDFLLAVAALASHNPLTHAALMIYAEVEMKGIFQRLFPYLGLVVFILFLCQLWKDYDRPYVKYQKEFRQLLIQKSGNKPVPIDFELGVRQRWIEKLDRIDRCESCHLGVEDPRFQDAPQPFATHPDFERHNFEKFGCTVCHGGQGMATPKEDAHGPVRNWNRAIYHEGFMENSCSLCHGGYIQDQAPVFAKGRLIFTESGCRGCHVIKGTARIKVGPPLDGMDKRVKTDWLYRWIQDPKAYLPRTKMPNSRFSEQEAADISGFLLQGAKHVEVKLSGSSERGKMIVLDSRCVSCHSVEGKGGNLAPDLGKIGSKLYPERITLILGDPRKLWSGSRMPVYGFNDQEIRDVVTFLTGEYVDLDLDEKEVARQIELVNGASKLHGPELIEKYGCIGCHDKMEGVKDLGETGIDLTAIGVIDIHHLDFGEIKVAPKNWTVPNYLYNKTLNPRIFKPGLKMPEFSFNQREAEAVTTYLLSLKGEEVPVAYTIPLGAPPSAYAPQGAFGNLLDKYRCFVCHKISGRGGEMAPDLTSEGSRVKKEWLEKFMKAPDTIRPILVERMPPFKILDAENQALYAYCRTTLVDDRVENLTGTFNKLLVSDPGLILTGKNLFNEKYGCNACHQVGGKGGVIGPDLTKAGNRLTTEWIVYYLHNPKAFVARSIEPVYNFTEKEIEALTAFLVNLK